MSKKEAALRQLTVRQENIELAKREMTLAILRARLEGATWAEIGRVFGISRTAAFERFHRRISVED